jgi:3-methylcrotonyl-CoA carboxylase alpha subunit
MFRKVLIANRGEIAIRITRCLQELGVTSAVVYSDADRSAPHVRAADEAYHLPGVASADTYLNGSAIIALARAHGVQAIHPGYGFLSENSGFAQACAGAGLTFIGPSPEVIRAMGDKIVARATLADAGVPVVPGWHGPDDAVDEAELAQQADRIGYPVMLKAAAGGGGKGMRIVRGRAELGESLAAARREAQGAFGDARIFLEKYLERARHVEFQIFGDARGNVVHLFERECSIQRRHQKIIEESPAPGLSPELRAAMAASAVRAARALNYTNAGTVEFILAADGSYYFLEINTRLQVEHPVTELVTGQDLVRAQLEVAAGGALPFSQEGLAQRGHALECRIYAEDPARGYLPSTGDIVCYAEPTGPHVRVDSGVNTGSTVSVHYDPMLAKLIVWGQDRATARARMLAALRRFVILGVTCNIDFLQDVLVHPEFVSGATDTHFLERNQFEIAAPPAIAFIAAGLNSGRAAAPRAHAGPDDRASRDPWTQVGHWRGPVGGGEP